MVYDKEPFPTDAVQSVMQGRRVWRAAHYMAAMGLWPPTSGPVFPGLLMQFVHDLRGLLSRCPAVMNCYYLECRSGDVYTNSNIV